MSFVFQTVLGYFSFKVKIIYIHVFHLIYLSRGNIGKYGYCLTTLKLSSFSIE